MKNFRTLLLCFLAHLLIFHLLQGELLKQGRLDRSYVGVADCVKRTWAQEGVLAFWRGNFASVVRYFPQQVEDAFILPPYFPYFPYFPHTVHTFHTSPNRLMLVDAVLISI